MQSTPRPIPVMPENPQYGMCYVPFQYMSDTFEPDRGLKEGTIFPELAQPYVK